MYLGNSEIISIEGFLIGYDMANSNKPSVQRKLIKNIFENYRHLDKLVELENGNAHLLQLQIEIISKETNMLPLHIFMSEAMNYFVKVSDIELSLIHI